MTGEYINFRPSIDGGEGSGGSDDSDMPSEPSVEEAADQLEEIDHQLREAGHDVTERASDEEIRARIRERVNELERDELEISEKGHQEIRDFLTTMRIPGAKTAADQEIEILWTNLNQNPSLVKDFVLYLINRKTKNFYSEYPLLPDMKDVLEFADGLISPNRVRPRLIKDTVTNMKALQIDPDRIQNAAMSQSKELAEGTRLLGWLAGMPFMRGAQAEIKKYMEENSLQELTIENLAHVFIIIVDQHINMLSERTSVEYMSKYNMDREALDFAHSEVVESMSGIQDLLFKIFIEN